MNRIISKAKGIVLLAMFFFVSTALAEVEATFAMKHRFFREKGIKWEDATDKTRLKWLEEAKQVDLRKQQARAQQENQKVQEKALKEQARYRESMNKQSREQQRLNALYQKRNALAQKRQSLRNALNSSIRR